MYMSVSRANEALTETAIDSAHRVRQNAPNLKSCNFLNYERWNIL